MPRFDVHLHRSRIKTRFRIGPKAGFFVFIRELILFLAVNKPFARQIAAVAFGRPSQTPISHR